MYFNVVPQTMPYGNNQQWQGNYSYPSFQSNFSNDSSLGWSSYQNTGVRKPQFSPSYGQKLKLEDTLEKYLQTSLTYQKETEAACRRLEIGREKLAKQMLELGFGSSPDIQEPQCITWQERHANMQNMLKKMEQLNEQEAKRNSEFKSGLLSSNIQTNSEEQYNIITASSDAVIEDGVGGDLMVVEEAFERKEKEGENEESEKEKEVGVENLETFVNIENQKIEQEKKEREEADLRARVEAYKIKYLPYPIVPTKRSKNWWGERDEEVCRKPVSAQIPTLHTDVRSQEVKTPEKVPTLHTDVKSQDVTKSSEVHLKVFPPSSEDGKPKVKMRYLMEDGDFTRFIAHPKVPWPNGEYPFLKHFGGGVQLEGRKYSSLACLMPP